MTSRLTDTEAKAVGVLIISVGMVGANALNSMFGIRRSRAHEIEAMLHEEDDPRAEIEHVRSFLTDDPKKVLLRPYQDWRYS